VCIEVNDRDRAINLMERSEDGKHLKIVPHVKFGGCKGTLSHNGVVPA
jgi:hypothetical protein